MMRTIRRAAALTITLLLVGCGATDDDLQDDLDALRTDVSTLQQEVDGLRSTAATPAPPTSTPVTTTTTTTAPAPTIPPTTAPATTVPTTTTPAEQLPDFPPPAESLTHGGDAWVVVLAASEGFADPLLAEAVLAAEAAGYSTGPTDCDVGAVAALGLPDDRQYYTVSVYLSSEEDAIAARDAFAARGVGATVAEVQTFCLD
jgi:hypothetical protein